MAPRLNETEKRPNSLLLNTKSFRQNSLRKSIKLCLLSLIIITNIVQITSEILNTVTRQAPLKISLEPSRGFNLISTNEDVANLTSTPDLRAVKLSWTYPSDNKYKPVEFSIRHCELTSWNDEIKCRNNNLSLNDNETSSLVNENGDPIKMMKKDLQNEAINMSDTSTSLSSLTSTTVIIQQHKAQHLQHDVDFVRQLESKKPNEFHYEAQIFDLRAQTNYTFRVYVSRFQHEPRTFNVSFIKTDKLQQEAQHNNDNDNDNNDRPLAARPSTFSSSTNIKSSIRLSNGRKLNDEDRDVSIHDDNEELATNELVGQNINNLRSRLRVETKSFSAIANKCLANSSEVLVNTGRYFGGKISVENNLDPRCQLNGNKSSEQSTYLFRIDHELCNSKIVDENRVETMILVHENKDILTHNTARFLVLCHFPQKSFTLRASVALPKVRSFMKPLPSATNRAAIITKLFGKSQAIAANSMLPTEELPEFISKSTNLAGDVDNSTSLVQSVKLGSMPGIYRARSSINGNSIVNSSELPTATNDLVAPQDDANKKEQQREEVEIILKKELKSKETQESKNPNGLESSLLDPPSSLLSLMLLNPANGRDSTRDNGHRARSLSLDHGSVGAHGPWNSETETNVNESANGKSFHASKLTSPETVQVQSKVLYVEGFDTRTRVGRQQKLNSSPFARDKLILAPPKAYTTIREITSNQTSIDQRLSKQQHLLDLSGSESFQIINQSTNRMVDNSNGAKDEQDPIVVVTNNHRVITNDHHLPISSISFRHLEASNKQKEQQLLSDKKSQDHHVKVSTSLTPTNTFQGLPKIIDTASNDYDEGKDARLLSNENFDRRSSRMGKALKEGGSNNVNIKSNLDEQQPVIGDQSNMTLNQNLTGQFLKLSLKALSAVARKTVDLLMRGSSRTSSSSSSSSSLDDNYNDNDSDDDGDVDAEERDELIENLNEREQKNLTKAQSDINRTTQFTLSNQIPTSIMDKVVTKAMTTDQPSTERVESESTRSPRSEMVSDGFFTGLPATLKSRRNGSAEQQFVRFKPLTANQRSIEGSSAERSNELRDKPTISRWPIFSILFLAVSSLILILTVWFFTIYHRLSEGRTSKLESRLEPNSRSSMIPISAPIHCIINEQVSGSNNNNSNQNSSSNMNKLKFFPDPSYQRYNNCYSPLDNYSATSGREAKLSKGSIEHTTNGTRESPPQSYISDSTLSTSAGITEESECKNSELLLTNYVLMNLNSNYGESYA